MKHGMIYAGLSAILLLAVFTACSDVTMTTETSSTESSDEAGSSSSSGSRNSDKKPSGTAEDEPVDITGFYLALTCTPPPPMHGEGEVYQVSCAVNKTQNTLYRGRVDDIGQVIAFDHDGNSQLISQVTKTLEDVHERFSFPLAFPYKKIATDVTIPGNEPVAIEGVLTDTHTDTNTNTNTQTDTGTNSGPGSRTPYLLFVASSYARGILSEMHDVCYNDILTGVPLAIKPKVTTTKPFVAENNESITERLTGKVLYNANQEKLIEYLPDSPSLDIAHIVVGSNPNTSLPSSGKIYTGYTLSGEASAISCDDWSNPSVTSTIGHSASQGRWFALPYSTETPDAPATHGCDDAPTSDVRHYCITELEEHPPAPSNPF